MAKKFGETKEEKALRYAGKGVTAKHVLTQAVRAQAQQEAEARAEQRPVVTLERARYRRPSTDGVTPQQS